MGGAGLSPRPGRRAGASIHRQAYARGQGPALLATLLGIPKAQRRGLDSHIGNMTFRVGNLCEIDSDDPLIGYQIGLVARDGASIIGA